MTAELDATELRPLADLSDTGLLWLINRSVFHPRGLALAIDFDEGEWQLLVANEPWSFDAEADNEKFLAVEHFIARAKERRSPGWPRLSSTDE